MSKARLQELTPPRHMPGYYCIVARSLHHALGCLPAGLHEGQAHRQHVVQDALLHAAHCTGGQAAEQLHNIRTIAQLAGYLP